jgi:omega-6 fatty acid desaturase (delta-12 desaturase)
MLPLAAYKRSTTKALLIFTPTLVIYYATFVAIPLLQPLWAQLALTVANSFFIAILFIIGHDACHGSFTRHRWLNAWLGRIAFLPSLHPFTSWQLGHNRLHHCFTNLRSKDYVWTPLSFEEYRALPRFRRLQERVYRSLLGVGVYYFIEIWWRHMIFPRHNDIAKLPRKSYLDRISIHLFLVLQGFILLSLSTYAATSNITALLTGIILPQVLWNWLMGFVIFLHHTHPRVTWYDDPAEWAFFSSQVQGTVNVIFPWRIGSLLLNIMEHTAHHIDPRIPLYNLPSSQRTVCNIFSEDVIQSKFTLSNLLRIMAACQLYDYHNRRWLDFTGRPTTEVTIG